MTVLTEDSMSYEVVLTDDAKSALDNKRMPHALRLKGLATILRLGTGEWSTLDLTPLKGVPNGLTLYSSDITKSARIIWQVDVEFSERLNNATGDREAGKAKKAIVFADIIRIWRVCYGHDEVSHVCTAPVALQRPALTPPPELLARSHPSRPTPTV